MKTIIYIRPTFHLYQMLMEYHRWKKPAKYEGSEDPIHVPILCRYLDGAHIYRSTQPAMRVRHWLSEEW